MKKALLPFVLLFIAATSAFSQPLYSSTSYTSRFNPGVGACGTPIVAYDDVSIPAFSSTGNDSISITKINVGIRRVPNAPATTVNLYYTLPEEVDGNLVSGTTSNVFIGKVSLPANGNTLVTSIITLGDSVNALFKIRSIAGISANSYRKILIGASLDNPSSANGIVLTKEESNNADSIWVVNPDTDKTLYATSFNNHLPASYYLQVFGSNSESNDKEKNLLSDLSVDKNTEAITAR